MPTIPERLATLEEKQRAHEDKNEIALFAIGERLDGSESIANEAKAMVVQTNTLLAKMPGEIMKAIKSEKRGNRMESKEWIILVALILTMLSPWIIPLVYHAK